MSSGETGARPRSGLGWLRTSEFARLAIAVVAAAGVVLLVEALTSGGHHSSSSPGHPSQQALSAQSSGSVPPPPGGDEGTKIAGESYSGSLPRRQVEVANGPAVIRSLQHGSMVVVIDQPSSSPFEEQNRAIAQGAAVAAAEAQLPGHVHIQLLKQSLDGLSVNAVESRLRSEGAAALILPCDTNSQFNLAAGAARWGMLTIAPCDPEPAAAQRYATYWPVGMGGSEEAAGLAHYMTGVGYQAAFIVSSPGTRYGELLTSAFRGAARANGIQIAGSATIAPTTTNFSSLANAIAAASPKPETIFTALAPPFAGRLAAGLRAQGVYQPLLGTAVMDTRASGNASLERAVFASYGFPRRDAAAQRFAAQYRSRYGRQPVGSFPALGLETIRLLAGAARRSGSAQPRAIQQALYRGITVQGVGLANRAYEHGQHDPVGPVSITKIVSGSLEPVEASLPTP